MYAADCEDAHTSSDRVQDSHGYGHGPSDAALFTGNAAQALGAQARLPAGQAIMYPRNDLTYAENFLHMMFAVPSERYEVDPLLARALEVIMIVHMDHEQNASTSTVRTAGGSPSGCLSHEERWLLLSCTDRQASISSHRWLLNLIGCAFWQPAYATARQVMPVCRLEPGQPICMHRVWHCCPVGPCAWGCQ